MLPCPLPELWWDISVEGPGELHARELHSRQLKKECGPDHQLFGRDAHAAAKCRGCDRVLYELDRDEWAVVHLTWTSNPPGWPTIDAIGAWPDVSAAAIEHAQSH
jgi:hypothetical protein